MGYLITELQGDGIGPELSHAVHTFFKQMPIEVELIPVDLSLESRNHHASAIYDQAYESIQKTRYAIKYPTITENESPNAVLRRMCNFSVIHRPVVSIPGLESNFSQPLDVDIIRVATGGTYEDPGRMIGEEAAVSIRVVERRPCEEAARFAFKLAKETNKNVTSASKYTIQKVTDGFFQKIVDKVAIEFSDVDHHRELFDALLAKIVINPQNYSVIIVLNEYGDFLSDMACGLVGSMGVGGSGNYSFHEDGSIHFGLFDPAGGTAPDIAGKNICNPSAIFIALTLLLHEIGEPKLSVTLKESLLELLKQGKTTPDLGGNLSTTEFTQTLISQCLKNLDSK